MAPPVFVSAYARPPWSETWSIEAAIENVTNIVGTLDIVASVLSFARQLADLKQSHVSPPHSNLVAISSEVLWERRSPPE
jgi:hypothetical protein